MWAAEAGWFLLAATLCGSPPSALPFPAVRSAAPRAQGQNNCRTRPIIGTRHFRIEFGVVDVDWQSHDAIQHQKRKMHAVPLRQTDVLLLHARTLYGHGLPQHETNAYLVVRHPHPPTAPPRSFGGAARIPWFGVSVPLPGFRTSTLSGAHPVRPHERACPRTGGAPLRVRVRGAEWRTVWCYEYLRGSNRGL